MRCQADVPARNWIGCLLFLSLTGACVVPGSTVWAQGGDTVYVRESAYDGRVLEVRHQSAALGVPRSFHIFVPPEASDPEARFPTLYLLRGHFREWVNKDEDGTRGRRNAVDVYLKLRGEGAIGPMILVFPGLTAESRDVHSCGVNMRAPGDTASLGTGRFEDYLVQDLVPYVDAHYATIAGKAARGVDGYSLGGAVSVTIALKHPDRFSTVGALDSPHWLANKRNPATVSKKDTIFHDPYFDAAYGVPRDYAFGGANGGLSLLSTADESVVRGLTWLIEYGPSGSGMGFDRGKKLVKLLKAKGARNELKGAVSPFAHDWSHADEHLERSLPIHYQILGAAAF